MPPWTFLAEEYYKNDYPDEETDSEPELSGEIIFLLC